MNLHNSSELQYIVIIPLWRLELKMPYRIEIIDFQLQSVIHIRPMKSYRDKRLFLSFRVSRKKNQIEFKLLPGDTISYKDNLIKYTYMLKKLCYFTLPLISFLNELNWRRIQKRDLN